MGVRTGYVVGVVGLTFVLPLALWALEGANLLPHGPTLQRAYSYESFMKWFVLCAVGLRWGLAGLKQMRDPHYTACVIFKLPKDTRAIHIVRELGFASFCSGLVGVGSLFSHQWRSCVFLFLLLFTLFAPQSSDAVHVFLSQSCIVLLCWHLRSFGRHQPLWRGRE